MQVEFRCLPGNPDTPLFWRKPLLYRSCATIVNPYTCNTNAPPQPPSSLEYISANETAYFPFEDTLHVTIFWRLPRFPNGILLQYQLRIGTVPIAPKENTLESGTVFKQIEIEVRI